MTLPPRWSELEQEPIYKQAAVELCITCVDPKHDTCSMTNGCPCCGESSKAIDEEGNHNRFAANDTSNDELYMGEEIGPIAGAIGDTVASTWQVTADALPDATGAPDNSAPISPADTGSAMGGSSELTTPPAMQADPNQQMGMMTSMASSDFSSWESRIYLDIIRKEASDSDVYFQGYADATSGKEMDEGLANLSMDYYQGYKQGLLYNEENLQSAPFNKEDINSRSYYPEKTNNAPYSADHSELRGQTSILGYDPSYQGHDLYSHINLNGDQHTAGISINITRTCDGCGAQEHSNGGHSLSHGWENDGDNDYCPDCSYFPCPNCDCDPDLAGIDHRSNCGSRFTGGNCACPPCGCDCHE